MINLNDESFDKTGGDVVIFNNGDAGIVENVTINVVKKKPEDKADSPEYKIVMTDSKEGSCNMALWYVQEATSYNTVEELTMKQGKVLKHLVHAVYGSEYKFPPFENSVQMLDGCMKLLKDGLSSAGTFRVFANYGTPSSAKKYIQPRSWVPFIESMKVPIAETRLKPSTLDQMVRLEKDVPLDAGAGAATTDDWE